MDRLLFPGFSLSEAGQLYARRFEERSRNLALDFAQSRALLVLAENEGVTQQRLSELTGIASPWLVRILDRLEVMGLAQRRPHLADRRARSLAITEDARAVLPLLWNIRRRIAARGPPRPVYGRDGDPGQGAAPGSLQIYRRSIAGPRRTPRTRTEA
jgi:DNA-binding MarR family transcriptional regulator